MKSILPFLMIVFWLPTFSQTYVLKKEHTHKMGKQVILKDKEGRRDGLCKFYNTEGKLDSIVTYDNGKRNGLKTFFYTPNDIFLTDYANGKIIRQRITDSLNNLKYQTPLDTNALEKVTFHFKSGREYFDTKLGDTLILSTNVPEMNFNAYFPGAMVFRLNKFTYRITKWEPQPNSETGKIVAQISQDVFDVPLLLREQVFFPTIK